jgi:hypothetical protein
MSLTAAQIKAALPMSLFEDAPSVDRQRWALAMFRGLWGEHDGWACLAHGRPHLDAGKYRHDRFTQEFYRWPEAQVDMAGAAIKHASHGLDVWMAPMLRTFESRKKDTGAGGRFAWVDLDEPLDDNRLRALRGLGDAVRVISSGTGHHAYVELDDWKPRDEVVAANRALAHMLDGDHKWDDTALLRPVGTYNRKALVRHGHPPALVQVINIGDGTDEVPA